MSRWTAEDIPDQTGRTALITGANSGLGLHTALGLARRGAHVLLGCRDAGRGEQALETVQNQAPAAAVELVLVDLADLTSVRRAAQQVSERVGALDLLMANAGVMVLPYRTSTDGFEMQIATNHLGHFALVGQLLATLRQTTPIGAEPRVVVTSSEVHRLGKINLDKLSPERRNYHRWLAYGQSKLANLLFMRELQHRSDAAGWGLLCAAAHPGYAATNLQLAGPAMRRNQLGILVNKAANALFAQSDAQGALPQLYAATMPDVSPGDYWGPDGPANIRGYPSRQSAKKAAYDDDMARRLWERSEQLTGVHYG